MIRLSVIDLDQYLYWMSMEDVGPEWLIDRLTIFKPSPAMQAGSAFHGALEHLTNDASLLTHDGYKFNIQCDAEISLPTVRELKIEREIMPGVVLVGKIDAFDGSIIDYKLTERLDAERYADSYQWRAYLMLFEAHTFEYSVFEGSSDRGRDMDYTIHAHHRLRFFAYDGMREDVIKCAGDLAAFVQRYDVKDKIKGDQS
jgi:hypothetical protein